MAKAASPIRLQSALMENASVMGKLNHRSAAEQIEYWASIGQQVESLLNPQTLLELKAGLLQIRLEQVQTEAISPATVFANLAMQRSTGELPMAVASEGVRYQASTQHPGYLEKIDASGKIRVGQFENGKFKPVRLS
ncbi:MAG TPA: hypothetical protein VFV57_01970 [Limnobacter sp.]|nr:hypothetical protein [Limnobacter sp.]